MRKLLFAGISFGVFAVPAMAADMQPAPVYTRAPVFNWTGFYIGANLGGARADGNVTDSLFGLNASAKRSGLLVGGQVGFNYQVNSFVIGVEGNFDWTSLSATGNGVAISNAGTLQGSANTNWLTTAAARFGVAVNRVLFYGKAGGGWVGNSASIANLTTGASVSAFSINSGWLVGAGLEWSFAPHWSTKIEYDYLGLHNSSFTSIFFPADTFTLNRNIQTVTVGLDYTFGMYGYQ
jgi:outer membrane immunogenic protein